MAKLTKRQFTRRHLLIGVTIFVSVALVVTGLAIWLLFGTLSGSISGDLSVSDVAVSPMSFLNLKVDNVEVTGKQSVENAFMFDSRYADDYGRVTWDGKSYEKMDIVVSGTLVNADYLKRFYYVLELPDGVVEAAKQGYLDLSEFYDEEWRPKEVDAPVDITNTREDENGAQFLIFSFPITIKWGEKFGGDNPSDYFDRQDVRATVSDEEVNRILTDFKDTVMNDSVTSHPSFSLRIVATANR